MSSYLQRAAVYQTEYAEDRDVEFIKSYITKRDMSVLEVPCGAGRLAVELAALAGRYTIVDLEQAMLNETLARLRALGLADRVDGYAADMCEFDCGETFDLIIVPREALQLLEPASAVRAIGNLGGLLKKDAGRMVVDLAAFLNDGDPDYFYPSFAEGRWHKNWTRNDVKASRLTRWSRQQSCTDRIEFEFRYELTTGEGVQNFDSHMTLYRYNKKWVETNLPDDLFISGIWGNYDRQDHSDTSSRIIVSLGAS